MQEGRPQWVKRRGLLLIIRQTQEAAVHQLPPATLQTMTQQPMPR